MQEPGGGALSLDELAQAVASVRTEIGLSQGQRTPILVCILGGTQFYGPDSEALVAAIASKLDATLGAHALYFTGGMAGVQEAFARHCGAGARVFHLLPAGQSSGFGVGRDLHAGADLEQRKRIFGQLGQLYVTVEGGPGVAQEARDAFARGAAVVPLIRTGAASAGQFGFPAGALSPPPFATPQLWNLLENDQASVEESADAVVSVVAGFIAAQRRASQAGPARALTPGLAAALLGPESQLLLTSLATRWLKKHDSNHNDFLEVDEALTLAKELHDGIGVPMLSAESLRASIANHAPPGGPRDRLDAESFQRWFVATLRAAVGEANGAGATQPGPARAAAPFALGDVVSVLQRGSGAWRRDGMVVEALADAGVVDGQVLPAGAVKVIYDAESSAKWVPPAEFAQELRQFDFEAGDAVSVFSRELAIWIRDGVVVEVLSEPREAEAGGVPRPAGSVSVVFDRQTKKKWISPEAFQSELRRRSLVAEQAT